MITLQMTLVPYGSNMMDEAPILRMELYTVPFGKEPRHGYVIYDAAGNRLVDGAVPKSLSGHRNPLHLLKAVVNDIDLEALGQDYIKTKYD